MSNHIKSIHDELKSWCNELLGNDFYFKTTEHAVLNGLHESRFAACPNCTKEIIHCLIKGTEKPIQVPYGTSPEDNK